MIFVSTSGQPYKPAIDATLDFMQHGISAIELSGGAHSASQVANLMQLRKEINFQVHNYFPPPCEPFVFNLASRNDDILALSAQHVRTSMRLALALGHPLYSFHAGFRLDPFFTELGGRIERRKLASRATALQIFGEALLTLAKEAQREGIHLLVENNVVSPVNLRTFGEDPLLITEPGEIASFMQEMPPNVGLLLDLGHLKVTAHTIGFDLVTAHAFVKPWVRAYHLSDNDSTADSNQPLTEDTWFWGEIEPTLDYYSLEVHGLSATELFVQSEFAAAKLTQQLTCMELAS